MNHAINRFRQNKARFEESLRLQMALWNGERPERQPLILYCPLDEEEAKRYPDYNTKEIHYDSEKMLISQLRQALTAVNRGDAVPSVRAQMGCGIFPTLFGVRQELFEDKMPWIQEHLTKEQLKKMGPEDLKIGYEFQAGLDHMAYMAEKLTGSGCRVFPMDLQGPFDVAHLVYGDAVFYDLYDDPGFVHHLMELSCEAIFMGMEACLKVLPDSDRYIAHYNGLVIPRSKGGIKTSEDTSTLISKEHIDEFIVPYLDKVLSHFGGGYVHYCGKNDPLFEVLMNHPLVIGINFGNPEKHDMAYVLKRCAEAGKIYYGDIPRHKGQSLEDYFIELLTLSRNGDRSLVIPIYRCSREEQDQVYDTWLRANEIVFQIGGRI